MKPGKNLLLIAFVSLQSSFLIIISLLQKQNKVINSPQFAFLFYSLVFLITAGFYWFIAKEMNHRKKTEKKLQNYIALIDHTPIFIRNMQDEIVSWNKGMEKLYGWTEKEAIGQICHQLFATIFPRPLTEIKDIVLFNNQWQGEVKHTLRNNNVIDLSSHWSLIRNEEGYATLIMETVTDLRVLKQKEKQVATLSEVLNKSNNAIYTADIHHKIKTWNNGAERLYGFTREEALGQNSNDLLQTNISDPDLHFMLNDVTVKDHWAGELKRRTKQGNDVYVYTAASPTTDNDGTISGYISTGHDITDSIKLREQVTHLANLVDHSNDAITSVSLDGSILSWNKGAIALYGYIAEEAKGKNIFMIIPPEMINEEQTIINKIKNGTSIEQFETQRIKKDGSRIFVSLAISAVKNNEGKLIAVSGIARDISERREAEEKIVQSEENLKAVFENASEMNRVFLQAQEKEPNQLGRDLHDNICQMMAALKMKLDFCNINGSFDILSIEECIRFLDDAIIETRNISHRMIIPRFAESSLADALQNLSNTYSHDKRTVTLEYKDTEEKNIPVPVKEALYRIAQEKLNNIHKYAEASAVKVGLTACSELVRLTIEDNGVGFDIVKKKTGVGIANIINRAESFNGSAKITSSPGQGCQLLVEIPLCDKYF